MTFVSSSTNFLTIFIPNLYLSLLLNSVTLICTFSKIVNDITVVLLSAFPLYISPAVVAPIISACGITDAISSIMVLINLISTIL